MKQRNEKEIFVDMVNGMELTLRVLIADSWVERSRTNRSKKIRFSPKASHYLPLLQLLKAAGAIDYSDKSQNVVITNKGYNAISPRA